MAAYPVEPAPGRALEVGFRCLAWLNGLGVAAILSASADIISLELASPWLRFPLILFLVGLVLALLGLFWSFPVQTNALSLVINGRRSRLHWLPLLCTLIAYMFSIAAFVAGCWALQLLLESGATY